MKRKPIKSRNPHARSLADPQYRRRVVASKRNKLRNGYTKHKDRNHAQV